MTPGIETLRTQVRWLAGAVAVAMVVMFLAVALPWLARMIEIDLAPPAWTLTLFAAAYALLIVVVDHARTAALVLRLLYALPLVGAGFMAVLWHCGGGPAHPALALAMVLPVVAAAALPRASFAFDVALYSILVVVVAVAVSSADFVWYATQLGVPGAGLARLAGEPLPPRDPFPGATSTPAATFLFVSTFAVVQLATAAISTRVARFVRLREELAHHITDLPDARSGPSLAASALHATPAATVTVVAATGQIVQASKRFTHQMLAHNEPIVGRELTAVLSFGDVDAVRMALGRGGTVEPCHYHIGAEERVATLEAETFEHDGTIYATVVVHDRPAEDPA